MVFLTHQLHMVNTTKHVRFYTIGLYSSCRGKINRTLESINAEKMNELNKNMLDGGNIALHDDKGQFYYQKHLNSSQVLIYETYDVCYDTISLTQIVGNLILNESYTFRDESTRNHSGSLIAAVFTYMPVYRCHMDRHISEYSSN